MLYSLPPTVCVRPSVRRPHCGVDLPGARECASDAELGRLIRSEAGGDALAARANVLWFTTGCDGSPPGDAPGRAAEVGRRVRQLRGLALEQLRRERSDGLLP